MPFLNVTGVTNTHSTFNIAFGVINKEDKPAYTWALERLENLRTEIGADYPYVVVTDFEMALKSASDNVWGDVQQQICLWHVNKNVFFEVKKRWVWAADQQPPEEVEEVDETDDHVDPIFRDLVAAAGREDQSVTLGSLPTKVEDNPTGFLKLWKHLCYAATPDDFVAAWVKILEDFSQQEAIISYLQTTLRATEITRVRVRGSTSPTADICHTQIKSSNFNQAPRNQHRGPTIIVTYDQLGSIFRRARHMYKPTEFSMEAEDEEEDPVEEVDQRLAEAQDDARGQAERRIAKMERRLENIPIT
ncbi:hypothetical protein CHGG_03195 [Chaetomium globosum CBS 148.51]|uniref:MULE transposase domain-containing protein n=1 Tax=Chaetomium globosum (strain ATCC 6205 / CBS 148.51 / DSM 1962 / NBRC 6347 / NRRL 1970) TaxID=306901 RepID=Q2H9A9_CHAGB|nr:uncharacterized protein CHGG_03195 [Chaetomium globosum CBS 148.51]EAQ91260.1 hypothetical protein CHGG_03195 [Chaetomium globosum CBS 148.51]